MKISEILSDEGIEVDLKASSKEEIIQELIAILARGWSLDNIEEIKSAIFEREKLSSTGLSNGIAIPHAKVTGMPKIIGALGLSKKGIDFHSLDKKPSHIFFILVSPRDDHGDHVKTLSNLTKLVKEEKDRQMFLSCQNAAELLNFIKQKEN